ncbi:cupin domain-containing protein [Streptomyces sp. NPDC091273]|uniref:cupin domain-containing protein n=1 Tax=Streptomyces sp. NPDC091273 TaxID=3365982 RepID=UPI0038117D33
MAGLVSKSFDKADETRPFEDGKGRLDLVETDGGLVGRAVFEPGWKWSEHVKPLAGTDSCLADHTGYVVKGRMQIVMDDGAEIEVAAGDYVRIPPGHDAWVVGDEQCMVLDWTGYGTFAQPSG